MSSFSRPYYLLLALTLASTGCVFTLDGSLLALTDAGPDDAQTSDASGDSAAMADGATSDQGSDLNGDGTTPSGLLAHYTFEDNADDVSGLGNHAQAKTTGSAGPMYTPGGIDGKAIVLDGVDDYVELPATLLANAQAFTFAGWIYIGLQQMHQRVFDFNSGVSQVSMQGQYLSFETSSTNGTSTFVITSMGTAAAQNVSAPMLTSSSWIHIAVTIGGGQAVVYVDGTPGVPQDVSLVPSDLPLSQLWLGRSAFVADPYFIGAMDEVYIYSRALSAAEIATLASIGP